MHVQHQTSRKFTEMIIYLHSDACELVVFTQRTDQFISKVGLGTYIVIKDAEGIARAYVYEDTIFVQEED